MALAYATSPIGAHHKDAWVISWEVKTDRFGYTREKAAKVVELQRIRGGWFETFVGCRFPWVEVGLPLEWYAKLFKAATGVDATPDYFNEVGDRIYALIRAFWIREYGQWSRDMFKHLVVATAETFKAIEVKFGGVPPRRLVTAPGRVFEVGGVEVAVFDAGHIVGSVMYLVELDGVQILITGDYSVYGSILTDGAEPVEKPDILITEATYGDPAYVFPNKADVYNELLDLVERHGVGPRRLRPLQV